MGVDDQTFKDMLRFLYCGKFPSDFESKAATILPVATKYGIPDLMEACAEALKSALDRDNVANTLILADRHDIPHLKEYCLCQLRLWSESMGSAYFPSHGCSVVGLARLPHGSSVSFYHWK